MKQATGIHIVRKRRKNWPDRWYVYAWRGGPCIDVADGSRPRFTAELADKLAEARRTHQRTAHGAFSRIVEDFRASPDYTGLAAPTRRDIGLWLDRIDQEFGNAPLAAFEDRKMRGAILEWADRWAAQRGRLSINVAAGMKKRYKANRAHVIWSPADIEQLRQHASPEVVQAVEFAGLTGLRRIDLVAVTWEAVGERMIVWRTSKSSSRARVTVPMLPELRALLDRLGAGQKVAAGPILRNSRGEPWTPDGLSSSLDKARKSAGIDKHLHDLRGTFATRLILAGLTDDQAAQIMGWQSRDVAKIRARYVDEMRVVTSIIDRLSVNRL